MAKDRPSERRAAAARVLRVRETLGFSQRDFARELAVSTGAVAQWETRARVVPGPVLKLLDVYEKELGMSAGEEDGFRQVDASRFTRTLRLSRTVAGATAGLAGAAIHSLVARGDSGKPIAARAHAAAAERFVETLGDMKGLAMKVGQMVSFLDFALPEDARRLFEHLQSQSRPMAASAVAAVFQEEFGQHPRDLFAEWSFTPVAAASIGQVHRARLRDGRSVAVKVQYPGVLRALSADLANGQILDRLGSLLFQAQEAGVFIEELRARMIEECDYRREAVSTSLFADLFAGRPEIVIPRPIPDLSSGRILTTEWVAGERFQDFRASAAQSAKDRAGEVMFRFAFESIFRHHCFNADPHPGNYLFSPGAVAFLDFGCVRRYEPSFIARWKRFARSVLERDWNAFEESVVAMGFTRSRRDFDFAYHRRMILQLHRPWLTDEPFRFTNDYVSATWTNMVTQNVNKKRMNVPAEWVFLNRLQWGLFGILAQLGATASWRTFWLDFLYEPGEPRPEPFTANELQLAAA